MAAVSLAILGKDNEPLYVREFFNDGRDEGEARIPEEELFGLAVPPAQQSNTNSASGSSSSASSSASAAVAVDCSLRQQFVLHAALDRFEQRSGPPPGCGWRKPGVTGRDAMFVGLLGPFEDLRVYGYMTTTQIRFLLAVEDRWGGGNGGPGTATASTAGGDNYSQRTADESVKRLFVKLHQLYVEHTLNPFCELDAPIRSSRFDLLVKDCVSRYNSSD